jgi:hypothetical protein
MSFKPVGILIACAALASSCKEEKKPEPPKETTAPSASTAAPSPSASGGGPAPESGSVTRLTAKTEAEEQIGFGVAASGDRVVASAFKRKGAGDTHPGSVFVFKKKAAGFELEIELKAERSHQIGNAVAFEGDTLLVGAMYDDGKSPETGAAYVFKLGASGWEKPVKLSAAGGKEDDSFGIGVAIAGKSLAVSNNRETGGSLFVFEPGKTGFDLVQTLPSPEPNGPAEAIAGSGDSLAIGYQFAGKAEEHGIVHTFGRADKGFKKTGSLVESTPGNEQHFGGSLIAGPKSLAVASEKQITIFEEKDGSWKESARITPPMVTGLADCGLALDKDVLAIGLPLENEGRVLLYKKSGSDWKHVRTLSAPDGKKDDWFGYSLALGPKILVIGAPIKDDNAGAVYVAAL